MKECFKKASLPVAKSFLLSYEKELDEAISKVGLPLVIKPYDLGIAHVEIKIKDDKAYIIEVGARTGGDGIMDQIENAFGVNPYFLHISSYLGKDLKEFTMPSAKQSCAIAFLKAREGKIKKINELKNIPKELSSIKITAKLGDESKVAKDWSAREGVVEFFFKELFKEKSFLPISLSKALSDELFEVE